MATNKGPITGFRPVFQKCMLGTNGRFFQGMQTGSALPFSECLYILHPQLNTNGHGEHLDQQLSYLLQQNEVRKF